MMKSIFNCLLLLLASFAAASAASEFSLKGDPCAKHDKCHSKSVSKTCSCDKDCLVYGTCCHDIAKQRGTNPNHDYKCYDQGISVPVFAKRTCSDAFRGHVGERSACLEQDVDPMDVRNNLPMTSRKTKATYWNKRCAVCNNEAAGDLQYWNIEVFCPKRVEINRSVIQSNLTFDQDKRQWGLVIGDEFLNCVVRYAPPLYDNAVRHCTSNMISSCPDGYENEQVSSRCSRYYAERKVKNSDLHFKNVHCAICNNYDVKDLECPGMSGHHEESVEESDFRDMVEEVFTDGEWLEEEHECSKGFSYDPAREKCRRFEMKVETTTVVNSSAPDFRRECFIVMLALVTLLL